LGEDLTKRRDSQMSESEKIRSFQRKLYRKSKQEEGFRFYVLYDKIISMRFLSEAYKRVKANSGGSGVDGIRFEDIEEYGVETYLREIQKELETETYKPNLVLRVYIPKANGKKRPLGIPTIKDRIVQMSCKLVVEPIFEAGFKDTSYGFRPKRSAHQAIGEIKRNLRSGKTMVFDADLSSYFDTIPHDKLMILIAQRISDKRVLKLIKMWLKSPIYENGRPVKGSGKKNKIGTPQGGVISPLLANIYLHLVDKIVNNPDGIYAKMGIKIVRYADDFVLMGRRIPSWVLERLNKVLERMGLRMNYEKSKLIDAFKETFDFLGFTFRWSRGLKNPEKNYWNIIPSKKSMKKIADKLRIIFRYKRHYSIVSLVDILNPVIRGWKNYFTIPGVSYPSSANQKLSRYIDMKLAKFFRKKSQRRGKLYSRIGYAGVIKRYGLLNPAASSGLRLLVNG